MKRRSKKFALDHIDFLRGLLMAALSPALVLFQQSIDAGQIVINWKLLAMAGVAGGVGYLIKNFFTDPGK